MLCELKNSGVIFICETSIIIPAIGVLDNRHKYIRTEKEGRRRKIQKQKKIKLFWRSVVQFMRTRRIRRIYRMEQFDEKYNGRRELHQRSFCLYLVSLHTFLTVEKMNWERAVARKQWGVYRRRKLAPTFFFFYFSLTRYIYFLYFVLFCQGICNPV